MPLEVVALPKLAATMFWVSVVKPLGPVRVKVSVPLGAGSPPGTLKVAVSLAEVPLV